MRSLHETVVRWEATFASNSSISDLRSTVQDSAGQSPCVNGLRSICWKAFLLFENLDKSTWTKTLSDSRSAYTSLREHFLWDVEHPDDLSAVDPLADDEKSPWNILRQDEDLRAEIYQDVERCMPENLFFREPSTQSKLLDILFIFCKLNRDIGYRQGMHEILAPILWVVSRDAIDPNSLQGTQDKITNQDSLILENFDVQYMEHDAFTLFCIIMQTVKSFYELGNTDQSVNSAPTNGSPIVERSKRIHEGYLQQADVELAEHLTAIEVLPQIFLIRWIRLLFGREFAFDDVLSLWDILFAEDPTLNLVDLICVSMLLRIRWQLIEADYTEALTLLLRYPAPSHPHGPSSFVEDALYLQKNLLHDGGAHIISKYSGKAPIPHSFVSLGPKSSTRRFPSKGKRTRPWRQNSTGKVAAPIISPSKFFQDQGGIEGIIQEAAKGVYSRSEKWGVARALRGAMQGLQSGNASPKKLSNGMRWSLDDGNITSDNSSYLAEKIRTLEQRNTALAKMLEYAMEEFWIQQRTFTKDGAETAADALSLAIAKVQFVQVYLENSNMPFPTENPSEETTEAEESSKAVEDPVDKTTCSEISPELSSPLEQKFIGIKKISETQVQLPAQSTNDLSLPAQPIVVTAPVQKPVIPDRPGPSPFHHPRPSLAQSSFSWMLGEDQRRSSFVSPSPFPSEKRSARSKAGFLFGDDKVESGKHSAPSKGKETREEDDEESITLGTLKVGGNGE